MLVLTDEEAKLATDMMYVVQEFANDIVQGKQYWTTEEVQALIIKHVGEEAWEIRVQNGVLPV